MRLSRGIVGGLAGAVVTLAAGVVVVTLGPLANAATAPTAPFNALTVRGGSSLLPRGETRAFDTSNATITGGAADPAGGIQLSVTPTGGGGAWNATITPPTGADLTATTYQTAATADDTHAAFSLTGEGRSCVATGSVNIKELTKDDAGAVTAFAVTYSYTCPEQGALPIQGEMRYQSQQGYVALTNSPTGSLDFGTQDIGRNGSLKTVTVTSFGSNPLQPTVSLSDDTAFSITANTCSGQNVSYSQTCTITVAPHPTTTAGPQTAILAISDNSGFSSVAMPLSVTGKVGAWGTFYPLGPSRILDTRSGIGARKGALGQGGSLHLTVGGHAGVPNAGVGAVVLNVTVTAPTAQSFLTVWPTGTSRPTASSLNFPAGWTGANSVTVPLGSGGQVDIFNSAGSVQVIADVLGFYAANDDVLTSQSGLGGQFQPAGPARLLDTRAAPNKPLPGLNTLIMPVDFDEPGIIDHVRALAVNITAVRTQGTGYLTAWNGQGDAPLASTLDFVKDRVVPNFAIVPLAPCSFCGSGSHAKMFAILNGSTSQTDVIVDVFGFYDDSQLSGGLPLRFHPLAPTRIVDSRIGQGGVHAIGADSQVDVKAPDTVADENTFGLLFNLTAVSPTANTFLSAWPDNEDRPLISNLNPAAHQTVPNAVVTLVGPTNGFFIYNSVGTVNVVVDVNGSFQFGIDPATVGSARAPNTLAPSKREEYSPPRLGGATKVVAPA